MYGDHTDRACRVLLEMRTEAFVAGHDSPARDAARQLGK
jgi:hypothetical protein